MSSNIVPFSFEAHEVRAVVVDGSPLFGSRDVAVALAYANPAEAYKDHCKSLKKLSYSELLELKWVNPNPQGEYVMPESDVYRLIVKSNKPEAERFEKWLFEEVLPTIRKTGSYSIPVSDPSPSSSTVSFSAVDQALRLTPLAIEAAKAFGFTGNHASLSADRLVKATTNISVLSLMGETKLVANENGRTYIPTDLGKLIDPPCSARAINRELEDRGLQKRDKLSNWVPTDKAKGLFEWVDTGKKHSDGTPVKQLRWFRTVLHRLFPVENREAA